LQCRIVQDSGAWTFEKVCKRGLAVSFSTGTRLFRFYAYEYCYRYG
jgi:hypothetical protein